MPPASAVQAIETRCAHEFCGSGIVIAERIRRSRDGLARYASEFPLDRRFPGTVLGFQGRQHGMRHRCAPTRCAGWPPAVSLHRWSKCDGGASSRVPLQLQPRTRPARSTSLLVQHPQGLPHRVIEPEPGIRPAFQGGLARTGRAGPLPARRRVLARTCAGCRRR